MMVAARWMAGLTMVAMLPAVMSGQDGEHHRRGYKPLPPLATIVVHVQKGFNGKPLENAAVVFHSQRDGRDDGSLEVKTDPEGDAKIDLLEVGSTVNLQVIADGFATYATDFAIDTTSKQMTVNLIRPRAQVSTYQDSDGQASARTLGVQEPPHNDTRRHTPGIVNGSFSGTLKDAAGARIPGGLINIRQLSAAPAGTASTPGPVSPGGVVIGDTSAATVPVALANVTTASDADGDFHRRNLPAGHYRVEITAPGFQTQVYADIQLVNGDDYHFDKPLVPSPAIGDQPQ